MLKAFRFCGQCGQALAAAFRPSPQGNVTIMFTDIEGFTSLARTPPLELLTVAASVSITYNR